MKDRIRQLRKELGLNQTEFGCKIGVKQGTVAGYEIGTKNPMDAVVISICREFNVNEEWLRNGTGEMFKKRLPTDPVGDYVEELLTEDNAFFDLIKEMMRTYHELDEPSRQAMLNYFRLLKENLVKKKEGD